MNVTSFLSLFSVTSALMMFEFSQRAEATPMRGRIAVFQDILAVPIEVVLPEFSGDVLKSDLVVFANLPKDLLPDKNGCLCFELTDERFAFVHTYYHASKQLEFYNKVFSQLGLPRLPQIEIKLEPDPSMPTSGSAGISKATLTYSSPALDISSLAHEIGHFIHFNAAGREHFGNVPPFSMEGVQHLGVKEGSANMLAALYLGVSQIGKYDGYDFYYDIDSFIQFPDYLISKRDQLVRVLSSPKFSAKYPIFASSVQTAITQIDANPTASIYYSYPDPYLSSAVINQPLWRASIVFGADAIRLLYVKAISELKEFRSYSDLANALLVAAKSRDIKLYLVLKDEYILRGLTISN